jgi:predicted ATPase
MKAGREIKLKFLNLGSLKNAEFELGKFTIICGKNNTGKTYATYALFGFLSFWREAFSIKIPKTIVDDLLEDGYVELDVQQYVKEAATILEEGCFAYTKQLPAFLLHLIKILVIQNLQSP